MITANNLLLKVEIRHCPFGDARQFNKDNGHPWGRPCVSSNRNQFRNVLVMIGNRFWNRSSREWLSQDIVPNSQKHFRSVHDFRMEINEFPMAAKFNTLFWIEWCLESSGIMTLWCISCQQILKLYWTKFKEISSFRNLVGQHWSRNFANCYRNKEDGIQFHSLSDQFYHMPEHYKPARE